MALTTSCEVNIGALGKQSYADRAGGVEAQKRQATCTQTPLYTPLITVFHEGQP